MRGTAASRIQGRGALVRSLRLLLIRTSRFGRHRARTPEERKWAAQLLDALDPALRLAAADPVVQADAARVEQRAEIRRKTP